MSNRPSLRVAVLSFAFLLACGGQRTDSDGAVPNDEPLARSAAAVSGTSVTKTFTVSTEDFLNPERGWTYPAYLKRDKLNFATIRAGIRGTAYSLVHVNVPLNDYLGSDQTRPLPAAVMTDLASMFAAARANGIKIVLRFQYNQGATYNATNGTSLDPDSTKAAMLQHIDQVAPTLRDNADVLAVMEAGFIGEWGEWHDSGTSGLIPKRDVWLTDPANASNTREVMDALLAAVPSNRMVQMRYPIQKAVLFYTDGIPMSPAEAFTGSGKARVGHHNDCYLSSSNDVWTYPDDPASIELWKSYVAQDTQYTPFGGETCGRDPRNGCSVAVPESRRLHLGSLNHEYYKGVYTTWKSQGCYDTISKGMGYRLAMTTAVYSGQASTATPLEASITLRNDGFASMYNARPVFLVLSSGAHRYPFQLDADPRWWQPGQTYTLSASLPMSGVAPGTYTLALWLPDASPTIQSRPAFSVRFANDGVWDPANGWNVVGSVTVSP